MSRLVRVLGVCAFGVTALVQAQGQEQAPVQPCDEPGWRSQRIEPITQGGRLYDNWWATCRLPEPVGTHPSYPAVGKQSGPTTWRCKECHGWDYRGKDGAYATGSHATGIVGIRAYAGRDEQAIVGILKNGTHRFDTVMPPALLQRIARFVRDGQVDAGRRIDRATKRVSGAVAVGQRIYARECRVCHGAAGRALDFSTKAGAPEYVGTIAVDNPWEAWHKIRHGQPGAVMTDARLRELAADPDAGASSGGPMRGPMAGHMGVHMFAGRAMPAMHERLTLQQQLDLLSFLQTLPTR